MPHPPTATPLVVPSSRRPSVSSVRPFVVSSPPRPRHKCPVFACLAPPRTAFLARSMPKAGRDWKSHLPKPPPWRGKRPMRGAVPSGGAASCRATSPRPESGPFSAGRCDFQSRRQPPVRPWSVPVGGARRPRRAKQQNSTSLAPVVPPLSPPLPCSPRLLFAFLCVKPSAFFALKRLSGGEDFGLQTPDFGKSRPVARLGGDASPHRGRLSLRVPCPRLGAIGNRTSQDRPNGAGKGPRAFSNH